MGSDTDTIFNGTADNLGSNIRFFFLLFGGVLAFAFGVSYLQRMK
ncbi:MAG: hypothetical protein NVSMB49_28970 [Ktedonobacteraceae bacterium]